MFTKATVLTGLVSLAAASPYATFSLSTSSSAGTSSATTSSATTSSATTSSATVSPSACPVASSSDTVAVFANDIAYKIESGLAAYLPPTGYSTIFSGLNASNNAAYGYLTYQALDFYDTAYAAAQCNAMQGCESFNIYFERDPTVAPTVACPNPPSNYNKYGLFNVKVAYYSSILTAASATNVGQWQGKFQVAIAGSNAYVKQSIFQTGGSNSGYTPAAGTGSGGHVPSDKAINAPLNCDGSDPLAGMQWWNDGQFQVSRCAQACTAHSAWVAAQGGVPCNFFNTFMQTLNGNQGQQMCTFYSTSQAMSEAVNGGNADGSVVVSNSYAFVSSTYGGNMVC